MINLASKAMFSDQGSVALKIDLPAELGLLDANDVRIDSLSLSADVALTPNSPAVVTPPTPTPTLGTYVDNTTKVFDFGRYLLAGTRSDVNGDQVKGVWVTNPTTGGDFVLGGTMLQDGERKFVVLGGSNTSAVDLEDLKFKPDVATSTSVPLVYVVEDTRGALGMQTYNYTVL